jgi:hypothetical protein
MIAASSSTDKHSAFLLLMKPSRIAPELSWLKRPYCQACCANPPYGVIEKRPAVKTHVAAGQG